MVENSRDSHYFELIDDVYRKGHVHLACGTSYLESCFIQCALAFKDIDVDELKVTLDLLNIVFVDDIPFIDALAADARKYISTICKELTQKCIEIDYLQPLHQLTSKLHRIFTSNVG